MELVETFVTRMQKVSIKDRERHGLYFEPGKIERMIELGSPELITDDLESGIKHGSKKKEGNEKRKQSTINFNETSHSISSPSS